MIGRTAACTVMRVGFALHVTNAAAIPAHGAFVVVANHTSHLDAVVLWASLPDDARSLTRPVAAREYWESSAIPRYLSSQVFRAVLINRRQPGHPVSPAAATALIEEMAVAMGDRHSLIVFPEGTRGSGEDLAPFKSGLYHLALRRPDVELVPAYLENLNRILPKGEVLPVPLMSTLTFGPPLRLEDGEEKRAFLDRTRQAVLRLRRS